MSLMSLIYNMSHVSNMSCLLCLLFITWVMSLIYWSESCLLYGIWVMSHISLTCVHYKGDFMCIRETSCVYTRDRTLKRERHDSHSYMIMSLLYNMTSCVYTRDRTHVTYYRHDSCYKERETWLRFIYERHGSH